MNPSLIDNPFSVRSPEEISAEDMRDLFVGGFTDYEKVPLVGHTFLHGPRGCGKSMMFRFMQPDSQCVFLRKAVHELSYLAVYVPIKNMGTNRTELVRLQGHAADCFFNEHVLCVYILEKFASFLAETPLEFPADLQKADELQGFYDEVFRKNVEICGHETATETIADAVSLFKAIHRVASQMSRQINDHIKELSYAKTKIDSYNGALCGYHDFLLPLLKDLKTLSFMPKSPVYLLIDDADNLNVAQTKILNSWVATRTHVDVSIKVSTQLRYKTFRTFSGQTIDTPHDYSEVNISTLYTSHKRKYYDRLKEIVKRRLHKGQVDVEPESFFPEDADQSARIEEIKEGLRKRFFEGKGVGNRVSDDVTRYARPDLIKSLGGTSKSTHTYSYSGFEQLVHLSSGIVRHFLEPASKMYSDQLSHMKESEMPIRSINPSIQDATIRDWARDFLFGEMDRLQSDAEATYERLGNLEKLANLLAFLGGAFSQILKSDKTERRVFSIAFSNPPEREVLTVMKLGVEEGFFHESTIGNKEGTGRTRLFVMSRRLAPCFNLDPTSFASYFFVTNEKIQRAMHSPQKALREVAKTGIDSYFEIQQLSLFDE